MSSVESIRNEMRAKVHWLAEPSIPGESAKSCIFRVSQDDRLGLGFNEVWRLWYRRWKRVPTDISDRVREAAKEHERSFDEKYAAARARQDRLYALIHHSSDPDFYSARAVGLGAGVNDSRSEDSKTEGGT